jgi:hypothetical protein
MASGVRIVFNGAPFEIPTGMRRVSDVTRVLPVPEGDVLMLVDRGVEQPLVDHEEIDVRSGVTLISLPPLNYRPSPKHKRAPSRGVKGTFCPHDVDPESLLRRSYALVANPRERWATSGGCAFCARSDNADGWHGYPVRLSDVPVPIWRLWLEEGKITQRDLRYDKLCEG